MQTQEFQFDLSRLSIQAIISMLESMQMDSLWRIYHASSTGEPERRDTGVSQTEHSRTDLALSELFLNHLGGIRAVVKTHPAVGNLLHAHNLGLGISGELVGCKRAGSDQHSHIHSTFRFKQPQGQMYTRAAASGCAVNCTNTLVVRSHARQCPWSERRVRKRRCAKGVP